LIRWNQLNPAWGQGIGFLNQQHGAQRRHRVFPAGEVNGAIGIIKSIA
jgi:hypothetical protein